MNLSINSSVGSVIGNHPEAGTKAFRKKLPKAIRAAMERTFYYWLENFAPKHFERSAFTEYSSRYENSYKRDFSPGGTYTRGKNSNPRERSHYHLKINIRKGKDTDRPIVATGATERAFLNGSIDFSGSNYDLNAKWTGLPSYAHKYHIGKTMPKYKAFVEVSLSENDNMIRAFEGFLQEEINKIDPATRTYGRVVF